MSRLLKLLLFQIIVKWLTDQYWPWHLCKSSYETYETYETNEKEANWKSREELTQTNYASHPGTWKRKQEKGGTDPNIFDFIISDYSIIVKWLTDILLFDPNWPKSTWIDWNWPKLIQTDQNWLKLTKIYQNQPRLTQIDRNWPKLIEIDPNWPNSTQIDKIGGQYASASALASGQVTTKPVRKHWHDDKKLESQCVSTGVRTRYYNEDETKSKWVIDWQLTDWLTIDWLRLTEETEVRRTENLWFLVCKDLHFFCGWRKESFLSFGLH